MSGPTIFISYKCGDDLALRTVTALEAALIDAGYRVLRDVDIDPGERWSDELWRWLMECSGAVAVAVVTDAATWSDWCRREWSVLAARHSYTGLPVISLLVDVPGHETDILDHLQGVPAGPDALETIIASFAGLEAAPAGPEDYLAAHQAWLRYLYGTAPALGREPFTLSDVYIDTECGSLTWRELHNRDERSSVDPFAEEHGSRHDLIDTVLDRFGDPDFREPVVVQGPAGCGKSAFTLRLANRLADEGLVPVLVRFRDLRFSGFDSVDELLQDALRVAPIGEHPPVPTAPLFGPDQLHRTVRFRGADMCRLVLILDGWDEVTLTGNTRFQSQIDEWLPRLRQHFADRPGLPVRLLLTGRPSTAVDHSGLLRRATPVLTIRPMRPDQLNTYAQRLSSHLADSEWHLDLDRWPQAFDRYQRWFDNRREPGVDVLGSPLLALLAFRTMAEWPHDASDLFAQPTALYHALIDVTVANAGKAEPGPESTVHHGGKSLRRLLQRVAAAITAQNAESISFAELEGRLEDDGALTVWAERATSESTLHDLVIHFYFKSHPDLGCEFLHKSFREYLYAEAILTALAAAGEGCSGPQPPPQRHRDEDFTPGSRHYTASRALTDLLAPTWLTPEVRTHLFWLIERASATEPDQWVGIRDLLADLFEWWAARTHLRIHPERRHGQATWSNAPVVDQLIRELPRDSRPWIASASTLALDAHLGNALIQITAFVHSLLTHHNTAGTRYRQTQQAGEVRFRPFDNEAPQLIARIVASFERPAGHGLVGAVLQNCDLAGAHLAGADLTRADLADADLNRADLTRADLNHANLNHANLDGAHLTRAHLTGANLDGAHLAGAHLTGADLAGAHLAGANLDGAHLAGADLAGAHLTGANLDGAHLAGADLNHANLTRADLNHANLTHANLDDARLIGAHLTGADLTHARLDGTDLTGARLAHARLAHADLSHANLSGANLDGSILDESPWV
jgi:uncharacterized protein YjbI with pentapeptide repeats